MILACLDSCNDLNFSLRIDPKDLKETVDCVDKGMLAWYCATHPEDWEDDDDFSREDIESFYDLGYCEPTEMLLNKRGIQYELLDIEIDDDGEAVADKVYWF